MPSYEEGTDSWEHKDASYAENFTEMQALFFIPDHFEDGLKNEHEFEQELLSEIDYSLHNPIVVTPQSRQSRRSRVVNSKGALRALNKSHGGVSHPSTSASMRYRAVTDDSNYGRKELDSRSFSPSGT